MRKKWLHLLIKKNSTSTRNQNFKNIIHEKGLTQTIRRIQEYLPERIRSTELFLFTGLEVDVVMT